LAVRFYRAATGRVASAQHGVYDGGSAAHTCLYGKSPGGAITAAGPAFHAGVSVLNPCAAYAIYSNYRLGADLAAHAATDTFFLV